MHEKGHKGPFSKVGSSQRQRNQATRARGNQIGKTLKQNDQFKQYYGRDPESQGHISDFTQKGSTRTSV